MPPWVAKEKIETLLLASEMPVSIPRSRTVDLRRGYDSFGLWSFRFPPVLVRTGRRLPVQALGERRVLVAVTGYPRGGARDRGEAFLDFGVFAFLSFSLGPAGDCPCRHYVRGESWLP